MKNTTKLFIVLIIAFILVLFSVINAQQIEVNFIITQIPVPLAMVMIGAVLLGALIVAVVMGSSVWKKNKTIKQLNHQLIENERRQEEELDPEINAQIFQLKEELKNKEMVISDLRHQLVNQMMSDDTVEMSHWNENITADKDSD